MGHLPPFSGFSSQTESQPPFGGWLSVWLEKN